MKNRILIDASHMEETRVVTLKNDIMEDYEFQVAAKAELKGNIYLGKITKVEASLQAAFVDYGRKKQGFLPFNEINITHFNLSQEKLNEIIEKQQQHKDVVRNRFLVKSSVKKDINDAEKNKNILSFIIQDNGFITAVDELSEESSDSEHENSLTSDFDDSLTDTSDNEDFMNRLENENLEYGARFGYKIQDVIKPDQYILVQVVKDERGSKGASLTTHLSIAGRYCVLMPNSPFEGGISKKISSHQDRQRLKGIIEGLAIPENTNIIIRTASVERTDKEIIDDYHYVDKIWKTIQQQTLNLKKPSLLFEEGILIKRIIRDIHSANIDEIIIDGKDGFEVAKNFAKLIAPDIMKKIIRFNNPKSSLFKYYKVEEQIKNLYSPVVFLKSGGYLVINNTEALTAIDINSGKSKGKRNVEETALKTNLEACVEIARQIKFRDLGGLIIIDFIDMENSKSISSIEKKIRDLLKEDKAKIQVSGISNFGLLEISRQRIKTSIIEKSFTPCPKCQGAGYVRPLDLNALNILRNLQSDVENNRIKPNSTDKLVIRIHSGEAFYLLNNKREDISRLETILKASIRVECDDNLLYPFYLVEEDKTKDEELPETVTFLEKELAINANKLKEQEKNEDKLHSNNSKPIGSPLVSRNTNRNNNNKRNKFRSNKKFNNNPNHVKQPIEKKGLLRKLFGL